MYDFFMSPEYTNFRFKTSLLNETHSSEDRDSKIRRASNKGNISFMTNSFGRGTDFAIFDDSVKKLGGLHVIQTFLSVDASEEVQIQGRTARQGEKGSYKLMIRENELELVQLKPENTNVARLEDEIKSARRKLDEENSKDIIKMLNSSNEKHNNFVKFFLKEDLAPE